ncbi:MAG: hypothetical protein JO189_26540, partial [Deltaproteobacteria bacterium]|nr:hypothetical protein [Deltaproteobacteria bacterium]
MQSILRRFQHLVLKPISFRVLLARKMVERLKLGSYVDRLTLGAVPRPWYGQCVYNAAVLARCLGHSSLSVIEFGVAGGNGLLCLEQHACEVESSLGISIQIYGFDTGQGLTEPLDYRDLPYAWKSGDYPMDHEYLMRRLKRTRLILGDVRHTVRDFYQIYNPAVLGAVMFDLDLYSSTKSALGVLSAPTSKLLPRVYCYF